MMVRAKELISKSSFLITPKKSFLCIHSFQYSTTLQHETRKRKVVLLGCGWANFRLLKDIDLNYYDVSVVTPRNHFLFTPLLPSTASGTLSFRSIIEPIRRARREEYHYFEASCEKIDAKEKKVICKPLYSSDPIFELQYDHLVVGIGNDVNYMNVKGAKENAFPLKEIWHARKVRTQIVDCFERASNPNTPIHLRELLTHFVIVGAGATGVEAAAELSDLIEQDMRKYFPEEVTREVRITILEAGSKVLSMFDEKLQNYTTRYFGRKRIKIHTGTRVREVPDQNTVILQDGTVIKCAMVLWSAGIGARELLRNNENSPDLPKDERSRIKVDEYLRVQGFNNEIFATGDCSVLDAPLPQTAQVAQQQGKYLASYLNTLKNQQDKLSLATGMNSFRYHHAGLMAYIGGYRAITDMKLGEGQSNHKVKSGGFLSFVFWRSAYLTKLVSIRNKLVVPFEWFLSFWFGRDVSRIENIQPISKPAETIQK